MSGYSIRQKAETESTKVSHTQSYPLISAKLKKGIGLYDSSRGANMCLPTSDSEFVTLVDSRVLLKTLYALLMADVQA